MSVGLGVGNVEGIKLGDGLGIKDGLSDGRFVGTPVSGHSTQESTIDAYTADPSKPVVYADHVLASSGGVNTHSSAVTS